MKKTILKKGRLPFLTQAAAQAYCSRYHLESAEVVPFENGYAIEAEVAEAVSPEGAQAESIVEEVDDAEEGKAPVRKHKVTTPWKPATLLDIPSQYKDPRFVYRYCAKNREGNLEKKMAEGWEIDTELSRKMKRHVATIQDGTQQDTTTQIREMIVMRMPKEMAEARAAYFAQKAGDAQESANKRFKKEAQELTAGYHKSGTYGEVTVE